LVFPGRLAAEEGVMRTRIIASLTLIGWQAAAAILAFTGHVDGILSAWADPAWIVMILAVLLTPSPWVILAAFVLAAGLIAWAIHDKRRYYEPRK